MEYSIFHVTLIKVSHGQAVDGKHETKGRVYEDWVRSRLETGAT